MAGKVAIVTGATSGIGLEVTRRLAAKGCIVVLGCRSESRARAAIKSIEAENPQACLRWIELDLSSLASVRGFAHEFIVTYTELHLLVNNAGIMAVPYSKTEDGFERQLAVNYLGHFVLTGLLIERLRDSTPSRIVNVTSLVYTWSDLDLPNLNCSRGYDPWKAYMQSKLACMLFTWELRRRLAINAPGVTAACAHPGWTHSNLTYSDGKCAPVFWLLNTIFAQGCHEGALPVLYAATGQDICSGDLTGPAMILRGRAMKVRPDPRGNDDDMSRRLWEVSEIMTDLQYLPVMRTGVGVMRGSRKILGAFSGSSRGSARSAGSKRTS